MADRGRAAAFLDRDGTIVVDRHYPADPAGLDLVPGVAQTLREMASDGLAIIIISNQSGIARGRVRVQQYHAVNQRLRTMLADEQVSVLDVFVCPHHGEYALPCTCRKPSSELFERAARVHDIDFTRSLLAGDKLRDVSAAAALGALGILVPGVDTAPSDIAAASASPVLRVAETLGEGYREFRERVQR